MGREFLPPFTEGTLTVNVIARSRASRSTRRTRSGSAAEKALLGIAGRRLDRAGAPAGPSSTSTPRASTTPRSTSSFGTSKRPREEVLAGRPRAAWRRCRASTLNVGQPISHRLDHILSGIQAQVAIKLFGPDLDAAARDGAATIEQAIRQSAGRGRRGGRAADADPADPDPGRSRGGGALRSPGRRRRTRSSRRRSTAASSRRSSTRASGWTSWCASTSPIATTWTR